MTAPFLSAQPAEGILKTLLPLPLMRLIVNEASSDVALQNEILLAGVNRNRKAEEYINGYFETKFVLERLKEYGITDSRIIDLPTRSAKTQMVPYKEQMVEAVLPGKDYPNEELVLTAHLFEGFAKQGANDNISGCVAILETARTLRKLMDDGKIPPLKRTVRFLFVPEISGTSAYLKMFPEIAKRFFGNLNEDMVGEGLIKNESMLELVQSPLSLPSYFNDVMRAFFEWMGTTQRNNEGREAYLPVWSPNGSRDLFYYAIDPYSGGSDHVVFIESGLRIPAVMLCVWPDQWYHTSGDTVDKSDATQLKRVAVIGAAAAAFLAGAGPEETEALIAEVGARSFERLGRDLARAEAMVAGADKAKLHDVYRDADNFVAQALLREDAILDSVRFFSRGDVRLEAFLKAKRGGLAGCRVSFGREIEDAYKARCVREGLVPKKIVLNAEEIRLGKLVPERLDKLNGVFDARAFSQMRRDMKDAPAYNLGRSEGEVRNMIDGKRSILQIRNAVAAGGAPVGLKDVEAFLRLLEKTGYVKIRVI